MNSIPTNLANNLKDAYRACELRPLDSEDIERYYVDLSEVRKTDAIFQVNTILDFQEPEEFTTILFTGHRGCGKSTELKRIQEKWKEDYLIIYVEADEEIDIKDARYTDLYLVIIKQVEYELRKKGIKFDQQLLNDFESWFKEVIKEDEQTVEKSVSATGTLEVNSSPIPVPFIAKLLVKLLAQIKGSERSKKTIRQTLEQDISRLQSDINLLLRDGVKKLREKFNNQYKGFLIIFDNLDRVYPKVGDELFFDNAFQLRELDCNIIYTVPISVLYSPKGIRNFFDTPNIVPMINIYFLDYQEVDDLKYNENALKAVASLIEKRVNIEEVFESEQDLLTLAKASGGHVRQLMQMMRAACIIASSKGKTKIDAQDVSYAVKREQFDFERLIPHEHYSILAEVYLTKDIGKNEIGQQMLFNTSVLEYNGDARWNYLNPVVKQSDLFQQALKDKKAQDLDSSTNA
ncbi:MAG: AAA family ATPase [Gomphosphaeria aponina SAG 52.96 = DSM 107014]|uniref:AAA family ATPase n=1 Tax=Gomphosphaeria aponina SAG 52.96 = DSM 107014 TaxID=1521640 RepID=A0A941GUW5_9CHRO|nr:AAA family ATPase [Gomphosphaeria aponina SAG 52.96 = DSM 107014]